MIDPEVPDHALPPAHRVIRRLGHHSARLRELWQAATLEAERLAAEREAGSPPEVPK